MPDREKVIRGLECCLEFLNQDSCPEECPYRSDGGCWETMKRDALALLKEQTERIQFLEKWTAYLEGGNLHEGTGILTHDRNQG